MLTMNVLMRVAEVGIIIDIARKIKNDLNEGEKSKIRNFIKELKSREVLSKALKGTVILIVIENLLLKVL